MKFLQDLVSKKGRFLGNIRRIFGNVFSLEVDFFQLLFLKVYFILVYFLSRPSRWGLRGGIKVLYVFLNSLRLGRSDF